MDPNANLHAQADALATRRADGTLHNYDRYALYDLRCALRDWLCKGGAAPNWDAHPEAGEAFIHWDQTPADHFSEIPPRRQIRHCLHRIQDLAAAALLLDDPAEIADHLDTIKRRADVVRDLIAKD